MDLSISPTYSCAHSLHLPLYTTPHFLFWVQRILLVYNCISVGVPSFAKELDVMFPADSLQPLCDTLHVWQHYKSFLKVLLSVRHILSIIIILPALLFHIQLFPLVQCLLSVTTIPHGNSHLHFLCRNPPLILNQILHTVYECSRNAKLPVDRMVGSPL